MLIAKANTENSIEIFKRASASSEPVIFSTDTIYGIGAPLSDIKANEKIFDIKGREKDKPFPVLISSVKQLDKIAVIENEMQKKVIERVWPGPVTLILKARPDLNSLFTMNGTVGVRMPDKKWLRELIDYTGALSATSANRSGVDYVNDENFIINNFSDLVNFYVIEQNSSISSSAIIDISQDTYKIIRNTENTPDLNNL